MIERGDKRIYESADELTSCEKKDHLLRSIANQPNHLKSKKVIELLDHIDRQDDENLYNPKIHSTRIRELHKIGEYFDLPITVLVDKALEIFIEEVTKQIEEQNK